ncbi:MAG: SDR family NAD(P)-dependent oxidoreductase, partial [Candidatus Pacearchaeota archaeon]|nr:SDR family NAD(P)-dependent oxidoreductase [Candidatus Pacearchaeota archaeon]
MRRGNEGEGGRRVLIVGAGDAGEQLVRSMALRRSYTAVCFLDDSEAKQGVSIHGVKVAGRIADIPEMVARYGIEEIVVAMPSADSRVIRQAVALAREAGLRDVKVLPSVIEILGGKVSMGDVRSVQVQDLLGRESVSLDTQSIEESIRGKNVLVTGAAGSIGSEIARQVAAFHPSSLILLDQDESGIFYISEELKEKYPQLSIHAFVADIREPEKLERICSNTHPQLIFHAAAYKHVPLMEADENASEAVANNIFGTGVVVEAAVKSGVERFVFISTDKAVNPSSIMGATKRVGEMICRFANGAGKTKFISVRFGNVLDSRGNVVSVFRSQIERGGPV